MHLESLTKINPYKTERMSVPTIVALARELVGACSVRREVPTCVVCLDRPSRAACVPCGHRCLCAEDALRFPPGASCPVCRREVQRVIVVFDA